MRVDGHLYVQVPRRPPVDAHFALAGEAHLHTVLDAGGDVHRAAGPAPLRADAAAVKARLLNYAPLTLASRAGHHLDELAEESPLGAPDLAAPVAVRAPGNVGPRLAAAALAAVAPLGAVEDQLLFRA